MIEKQKFTMYFTDKQYREIQEYQERHGYMKIAEVIRQAVHQLLSREGVTNGSTT